MQEQRTIKYNKYVVSEDFLLISNYNSVMEFPFFLRAAINTSSKEYLTEKRQSINALAACFLLSGQRSTPTRAKKSIAAFKLREGALIGSQTTLRRSELHTIIDKLLIFVLPRLYSERRNDTFLETASLLFLNRNSKDCDSSFVRVPLQTRQNHITATNKSILFTEKETSFTDQALTLAEPQLNQGTKLLSQQEKTQLAALHALDLRGKAKAMHLSFFKAGNNNSKSNNERAGSKGPVHHLTLGIKDLLLIPEMQEFSPLFETVRGIDVSVALSNPRVRVKKPFLTEYFSFTKQNLTAQMVSKALLGLPQPFSGGVYSNSIHSRHISKQVNGVKGKRLVFDKDRIECSAFTYNTVRRKHSDTQPSCVAVLELERVTLSFYRSNSVSCSTRSACSASQNTQSKQLLDCSLKETRKIFLSNLLPVSKLVATIKRIKTIHNLKVDCASPIT